MRHLHRSRMTEQPVTKVELLVLSLSVGLSCGLAVLGSSGPSTKQREHSGHRNPEEFLAPTTELRAPLSQKGYGLSGYRDAAFPKGEAQEQRLY